jgi:acetyl esterase/lipase
MVLDLYLPPDSDSATTAFPVVLYVHGGGWMSGHTRHSGAFANWPKTLASIASNGYVVASVEYRLSGEAPFPAAFRDIQNAIRWLRSNASEYVIDKNRFVVWGGSAGGQLAALAATACGDLQRSGSSRAQVTEESDVTDREQHRESACIQGAVSWYGVLDFAGLLRTSAVETDDSPVPVVIARYLGCEPACNSEIVAAASPLEHVDSRDPPMLLIHGTGDAVVPVSQSERMQQAMRDAGAQAKLITIPDVGHSFIGASPSETIAASQLAFAETMSFIEQTVGQNPEEPR